MDGCNKIANQIVVRVGNCTCSVEDVKVYVSTDGYPYFSIAYNNVEVYSINNKIYKVEIREPHGIVLFNIYLWLREIDRIVK